MLMMDNYVINTVKSNDYGTCGINIKQAEKRRIFEFHFKWDNIVKNYIYTHKTTFLKIAVHFARSLSRHIHISDRK